MLDRIAKAIRENEIAITDSKRLWYESPHVNEFELEDYRELRRRTKRLLAFYVKKEKELDALTAMAA